MAAKLLKLPRPALAELRQLAISFGELDPEAFGRVVAAVDRVDAVDEGWTFVMLGPEQNRAVVKWLHDNAARPMVASLLWAELFMVLDRHTGEIQATRAELAQRVEIPPAEVSRIMTKLETCGAISRKRDGREVRYFMNPKVATHLPAQRRASAQAKSPELRVV